MINKAGATVLPNVDSIQSALSDFQEALQDGTGLSTYHPTRCVQRPQNCS
jgi:hypothetical protein